VPKPRNTTSDDRTPWPQRERGVVDDRSVRCGIVRALPVVLDQLGADTDALLAEFGLSRAFFDDPDNTLSYPLGSRLIRRGAEATQCAHFGVLVGRPVTLSSLGAVGFLMQASPSVGLALRLMEQHFHVHDRGGAVTLEVVGSVAVLGYRVTSADVEALDHVYAISALAAHNFVRALCGRGWRPHEVQLPIRPPRDIAPWRAAFDAPLRFNADRMNLVFGATDLAMPLPTADPVLYRMMEQRIEQLTAMQQRDLVDRVRDLMHAMIFLDDARAARIASRMAMSLRVLNRRLSERGTTLRQLREQALGEASRQLLANTEKPVSEIALILGYSDTSAFSRAFRGWHGAGPAQWRADRRRAA
jgi:AraC-like DNA-binding protein